MKLSTRTRIVIAILFIAVYMVSAFLWWGYSLLAFTKSEYQMTTTMHQADSINLAGELTHTIIAGHFNKGKGAQIISTNFHGRNIVFNTMLVDSAAKSKNKAYQNFDVKYKQGNSPNECYSISIKEQIKEKQKRIFSRKRARWISEATTMIIIMLLICIVAFIYLDRILRVKQQQNNFLLAITHELKTPIAAANLAIQTAQKTGEDKAELKEKLLEKANKNMHRLAGLIDDVLMVSRIDSIHKNLQKNVVPVLDLVEESLAELQPSLPPNQEFVKEINSSMVLRGDFEMLKLVMKNLITNAIKYGNPEKPIEIRAWFEKNRANISVADQGCGVPEKEKKKIFKKFYRIGDERTRTSTGTGLGLYLVYKILRQHSAIISVHPNKPCGTLFKIVFKSGGTDL